MKGIRITAFLFSLMLAGSVQAQTSSSIHVKQVRQSLKAMMAEAGDSTVRRDFLFKLCGIDCLHPSPDSLVGLYLAETKAQTVIRRFWRAPNEYSINPPYKLGPERLVIAVSKSTFPIFKKYFSSKHFLHVLNEHGNFAAFEGKRGSQESSRDYWSGEWLSAPFKEIAVGNLAIPIILDEYEGNRARDFFRLSERFYKNPNQISFYNRSPWFLNGNNGPYCGSGVYSTGCGTWIGNMPIGSKRVDRYYFSMGDDGSGASQELLNRYNIPEGFDQETVALMKKVWTVPGHQQLGEMIDAGANRRGEFDNAGWTTITLLGSASTDRVPIIFLGVHDARKVISPKFTFYEDGAN